MTSLVARLRWASVQIKTFLLLCLDSTYLCEHLTSSGSTKIISYSCNVSNCKGTVFGTFCRFVCIPVRYIDNHHSLLSIVIEIVRQTLLIEKGQTAGYYCLPPECNNEPWKMQLLYTSTEAKKCPGVHSTFRLFTCFEIVWLLKKQLISEIG